MPFWPAGLRCRTIETARIHRAARPLGGRVVAHRETALAALFPSDGDSSPSALRRWRDRHRQPAANDARDNGYIPIELVAHRPSPRSVTTSSQTVWPAGELVQYLDTSANSFLFSKSSPRRYAASTLSPTACARARRATHPHAPGKCGTASRSRPRRRPPRTPAGRAAADCSLVPIGSWPRVCVLYVGVKEINKLSYSNAERRKAATTS